ncbi:MAG: branched-chain amino acid transport system substrate-binding protein [Paracoccaceae bacterium]|jgi:branched-chain amino acid transport system substrate-binding protein
MRITATAAAFGLVCALAGPSAAQTTGAPMRVISLGGLTGAASGAAADILSARELVATEVNRGGGLADGRSLALEVVDVGCTGEDAADAEATATEALTRAGAAAYLGPVCSDAALAVARGAIALGVPMISDGATSPALSALDDGDLVFRTAPSDVAVAAAMADLAMARGYARVAIAQSEDGWSAGLAQAFTAAYETAGGFVTGRLTFGAGKADYRADLEALAAIEPADALILLAYAGGDGTTALRDALRLGAWQAVLGADGLLDPSVIDELGAIKLARVALVAPAPDRSAEAWQRFAAKARDAGIDPAAPLAAQGYDAAMVMALALVRSGGEGGAALAEAIREVTAPGAPPVLPGDWPRARAAAMAGEVRYVGASAPIRFDAAGDTPGMILVWKARGGVWAPSRLR